MDRSSRAQLEALFRLRIVHIFTPLAGPRNPDNRLHGDESGGSPIPCSLAGCRKAPIARAVAGAPLFESKTEVGAPLKAPRTHRSRETYVSHDQTLRKTTHELIPPKPKALLSA
jgi:hypothetical protein